MHERSALGRRDAGEHRERVFERAAGVPQRVAIDERQHRVDDERAALRPRRRLAGARGVDAGIFDDRARCVRAGVARVRGPRAAPFAKRRDAFARERREIVVAFAAQHVHRQAHVAAAIPAAIAVGFGFGQREEQRLRVGGFAAQDAERGVAQREQRQVERAQQPGVVIGIDRTPQDRERIARFGTRQQVDVAVQRDRHARVDERVFVGGEACVPCGARPRSARAGVPAAINPATLAATNAISAFRSAARCTRTPLSAFCNATEPVAIACAHAAMSPAERAGPAATRSSSPRA